MSSSHDSIFELTTNIPSIDLTLKHIRDANKLHFAHLIYYIINHISILVYNYNQTTYKSPAEDTFYDDVFNNDTNAMVSKLNVFFIISY